MKKGEVHDELGACRHLLLFSLITKHEGKLGGSLSSSPTKDNDEPLACHLFFVFCSLLAYDDNESRVHHCRFCFFQYL